MSDPINNTLLSSLPEWKAYFDSFPPEFTLDQKEQFVKTLLKGISDDLGRAFKRAIEATRKMRENDH